MHRLVQRCLNPRLKQICHSAIVHLHLVKYVVDKGVLVFAERVDHEVASSVDLEQEIALCDFVVGFKLCDRLVLAKGLAGSVEVAVADQELWGFWHGNRGIE